METPIACSSFDKLRMRTVRVGGWPEMDRRRADQVPSQFDPQP